MNIVLINFLYWFITSLQLIAMKIITHIYHIDNIVFNSFFRCITLPYYIYKLIEYKKKNKDNILVANSYDIINGIFDQLDIILSYIGFAGLSIGEYITFRTLSIVLGGLYLILYHKKLLPLQKMISMSLIFVACIILLAFYNQSNFFYSFVCITSAIAYSLSGFIIELNVKTDEERNLNFYWTKTVSYTIALFLGFVCEFLYQTISSIFKIFTTYNIIIIIGLELLIALLENFYYYLKIKSISKSGKNGSIITQFLDIMRRFTLVITGALLFSEVYTKIIYLSLTLMFIASLIGLIDYGDLIYFYHKYIKKDDSKSNINLPIIEIVCVDNKSNL
jgi:hypothetical protein